MSPIFVRLGRTSLARTAFRSRPTKLVLRKKSTALNPEDKIQTVEPKQTQTVEPKKTTTGSTVEEPDWAKKLSTQVTRLGTGLATLMIAIAGTFVSGVDMRFSAMKDMISGQDAKFVGQDAKLVGQDAKISGQNARILAQDVRLDAAAATKNGSWFGK